MRKQQRDSEVRRLAEIHGLTVQAGKDCWYISGAEGYRGLIAYNQKSRSFKAYSDKLTKPSTGSIGGLLNLLACIRGDGD